MFTVQWFPAIWLCKSANANRQPTAVRRSCVECSQFIWIEIDNMAAWGGHSGLGKKLWWGRWRRFVWFNRKVNMIWDGLVVGGTGECRRTLAVLVSVGMRTSFYIILYTVLRSVGVIMHEWLGKEDLGWYPLGWDDEMFQWTETGSSCWYELEIVFLLNDVHKSTSGIRKFKSG